MSSWSSVADPSPNAPDRCLGDPEIHCEVLVLDKLGVADRLDLLRREFGSAIGRTSVVWPTAFAVHIDGIVTLRAQEQMGHTNALPVVTPVQDALTFWDWTVVQRPREPMREHGLPLDFDLTVTVAIEAVLDLLTLA